MRNNGKVFRRATKLVCLFWLGDKKWVAWGWLTLMLALLVSINVLNVGISYSERAVATALQTKAEAQFWTSVVRYALIIILGTPIVVAYGWVKGKLTIAWRNWLSNYFLTRYLDEEHFYQINSDATVDNPDQRIQQDIPFFCDKVLTISMAILDSTLAFFSFITILWLISPTLVFVALAYSAIGTFVMVFFGRRLIGLQFNQEKLEADLRRNLTYTRENATQVASYRGQQRELSGIRRRLAEAVANSTSVLSWQRNLRLFKTSYDYFIIVIPMVMTAPMFFAGLVDIGAVVQAGTSFGRVLGALSVIVGNFEQIADFAASTKRLLSFHEVLDAHSRKDGRKQKSAIISRPGPGLEAKNLSVLTPDGERTLVRNLSFRLKPGEKLMISGTSGVGKSSVLKAFAGLWTMGEGEIIRPEAHHTLFVPQKAHMPLGNLRDNLTYPGRLDPPDEDLLELLRLVRLPDLAARVGGLDAERPWQEQLSTGEQQRIAFARMLLSSPELAILDEATSALDAENERELYELATASGATIVSVAHRAELRQYHDYILTLNLDGSWELTAKRAGRDK